MACKNETFDTGSKDEPSTQLHDVIDNGAFQDPFTNINIKDEDGGESMQESIGRGNEQDLLEKDDQLKNSISSNCDDSESKFINSLYREANIVLKMRGKNHVLIPTKLLLLLLWSSLISSLIASFFKVPH